MAELEQLVEKMEDGELTLDESLRAFERGVVLTRLCQNELKNAELKVQQLNNDGGLEELEIADPENG
jgi:exodeoxyribonuclease VII small subunit